MKQKLRKARNIFRPKGIILMYHRIADVNNDPWELCVNPELFKEQLEVLRRYEEVLPLQELSERVIHKKSLQKAIALTFDDGYRDNFFEAKKWLERYKVPATFFISSGYIGKNREFWWDELERLLLTPGKLPERSQLDGEHIITNLGADAELTEPTYESFKTWTSKEIPPSKRHTLYLELWQIIRTCPYEKQLQIMDQIAQWAGCNLEKRDDYLPMTKEELVRFIESDFIEIGAHTCYHPDLSLLSIAAQKKEIFEGKKTLEFWLNKEIDTFSYPFGKYNVDTLSLINEAGFQFAYTTKKGLANGKQSSFTLPRFQVKNWTGKEFESKLKEWL
ncbi:MAG: polysaccharide deacetylase family protein [Balneolales bacterium]